MPLYRLYRSRDETYAWNAARLISPFWLNKAAALAI